MGVCKESLRILLRAMTRDVQREIYKYRTTRWDSFLSTIEENHDKQKKAFWAYLSSIYKAKMLPFLKLAVNTRIVYDEQEITEELFNYFRDQSIAPVIEATNPHDIQIVKEYQEIKELLTAATDSELKTTSITEIMRIIKKIKGKQSSGYDLVSNQIIKLLPPVYIKCLINCFNGWLKKYRVPKCWKMAKITTLDKLKVGIPKYNQTRPIYILTTHPKIFEKVLLDMTKLWAKGNQVFPVEQSRFRTINVFSKPEFSQYIKKLKTI